MRRVGLLQQSTRTRLMYAAVQTKYVEASPLTWLTWRWTSAASVTWLAWTLDSLVSRVLSNGPLGQSSSSDAGIVQRRPSVQIARPGRTTCEYARSGVSAHDPPGYRLAFNIFPRVFLPCNYYCKATRDITAPNSNQSIVEDGCVTNSYGD